MTAQYFRKYARELSSQTIVERQLELKRACERDPRNMELYKQQINLLGDELVRRQTAIDLHHERFRQGVGQRGPNQKRTTEEGDDD